MRQALSWWLRKAAWLLDLEHYLLRPQPGQALVRSNLTSLFLTAGTPRSSSQALSTLATDPAMQIFHKLSSRVPHTVVVKVSSRMRSG